MTTASVAVCVATSGRPDSVERLLNSISEQNLQPSTLLIVDASEDRGTQHVCDTFTKLPLRYERSERGLPLQRCRGIELLRLSAPRYICMLDDDVTLAPDFLRLCVGFLESAEGAAYGGVSGYSMIGWAKPFDRLERLYSKVGLYDGELDPGRWLYCGHLVLLSHLGRFEGIHPAQYIPGTHAVWRSEVFERFVPPRELGGYALWEDVHLSLRVATEFKLGVLGDALAWHHRAPGGRPGLMRRGYQNLRRIALVLRDCDPRPTKRRYAAFLGVSLVDMLLTTVAQLLRLRFDALPRFVGSVAGWLSCLVSPPGPTVDAIIQHRDKRTRRRELAATVDELDR